MPLTILHTSDWHLGRALYGCQRYEALSAFLAWLEKTLERERVDVLLITGDVFDSTTPSNRAQALYYRFLQRVAGSVCRHVVVIAGNHDSPSFLEAPKELLRALNVYVVGTAATDSADEVLVLDDERGAPQLIVCAVPYLRERDIRLVEAGESLVDKEHKLLEGIRDHYARVAEYAQQKQRELGRPIPMIATGHLFAAGGQVNEGDGVRALYVGSLAQVPADIFASCFVYIALGHLHSAQPVAHSRPVYYSGAPLAMSFSEAGQQKQVCLVRVDGEAPAEVTLIAVPVFQALERIEGDWQTLVARLAELVALQAPLWLEIVYNGAKIIGDLRERLDEAIAGSPLQILRIRDNRVADWVMQQGDSLETLDDLSVDDVFERCLRARHVPAEQHAPLWRAYREAVSSLHEEDVRAE